MSRDFKEKYENDKFYHEWMDKVPYLKFPGHWEVRLCPPFGGALVRFAVKNETDEGGFISVYLDVDDSLGCMNEPYWEIYPYAEDILRVYMNDTDQLIKRIQMVLDGDDR